jgi:glycosyltransferase involved in cell wall biosynthesis
VPAVSVVISTYDEARWDSFLAAVRSVEQQTRPPEEIVIVVDHNPTLYARVQAAMPGVVSVHNWEGSGANGARTRAVQVAKGEILAFIDDDATAEADWLEQLELGYRNPDVLGVGGRTLPVWVDGQPKWFPEEFAWVVGCTYRGMPDVESSVRNLWGCNMSFRSLAITAAGGFLGAEHGFGHVGTSPAGCEETEFCIRLRQQQPDKDLLYRPQAKVHHRVPASRTSWRYFRSRCYLEGRSKARVSQLVGGRDGMQSERAHAIHALPRGVWRGIGDFVTSRDPAGLAKATAIVTGLIWYAAGFLAGSVPPRQAYQPPSMAVLDRTTGDQVP